MAKEHDLDQTIGRLLSHLSGHGQKIAFLFGSGTSCAVEVFSSEGTEGSKEPFIPDIVGLTEKCENALCGDSKKTWDKIKNLCPNERGAPNVEDILTKLYFVQKVAEGNGAEEIFNDFNINSIKKLDTEVRENIVKIIKKNEDKIPSNIPHRIFSRWLGSVKRIYPVEIFTVNYDILIESALESEQVPFFDGFVGSHRPFFRNDTLQEIDSSNLDWTRLWKIHGSVTWKQEKYDEDERIIRGDYSKHVDYGEQGKVIFPSYQKFEESMQQPYGVLMERLREFLRSDGGILVTIGFSFRDKHINDIVFKTIKNRPNSNLYALQFRDEGNSSPLVKASLSQNNIIVVCPSFGIIRGRELPWREDDLDQINLDISNGKKQEKNFGDFNCFCQYLQEFTPNSVTGSRVS